MKVDYQTKQKNALNDVMDGLFSDQSLIFNMTKQAKRDVFFIVNRRIAARYPEQCSVFNTLTVNEADVIDYWSDFLNGQRKPGWLYLKWKASSATLKEEKVSQSLVEKYCNHYNISKKDFAYALEKFPEETKDELKDFEAYLKLEEQSNHQQQ
jgi:hypothetical protein